MTCMWEQVESGGGGYGIAIIVKKRASLARVAGLQETYTTRLGCALIIAVSVDSSLPLRGGSRITTSGRSPFLSISERYFLRCLRKNCVLNTVFHCILRLRLHRSTISTPTTLLRFSGTQRNCTDTAINIHHACIFINIRILQSFTIQFSVCTGLI